MATQILKKECEKCKPIALKFWREFSKDFETFAGVGFLLGLMNIVPSFLKITSNENVLTKTFLGFLSTDIYVVFFFIFTSTIFMAHSAPKYFIDLAIQLEKRLFQICSTTLSFSIGFCFWLIIGDQTIENIIPDGYSVTWLLIQYNFWVIIGASSLSYLLMNNPLKEKWINSIFILISLIISIDFFTT